MSSTTSGNNGNGTNGFISRHTFFAAMIRWRIFSPAARDLAYMLLYQHLNTVTGRCDPAISTLAAETGMKPPSVERAIDELARSGWWEITGHARGAGRGRTNA